MEYRKIRKYLSYLYKLYEEWEMPKDRCEIMCLLKHGPEWGYLSLGDIEKRAFKAQYGNKIEPFKG